MAEQAVTPKELEALKVLWERKQATVRLFLIPLPAGDTHLPYTTVLSLMQAMEKKGLVAHEADGKAYRYSAKIRRDQAFRRLAGEFLDRVFDGAMDEYVARALESRPPAEDELKRLEALVADARRRAKSRHRKG